MYGEENLSHSDVDFIAGEKARQAYYDAINYVDDQLRRVDERHVSTRDDIYNGLSELNSRVVELENYVKQLKGQSTDA